MNACKLFIENCAAQIASIDNGLANKDEDGEEDLEESIFEPTSNDGVVKNKWASPVNDTYPYETVDIW